jgi:hypothetical protein
VVHCLAMGAEGFHGRHTTQLVRRRDAPGRRLIMGTQYGGCTRRSTPVVLVQFPVRINDANRRQSGRAGGCWTSVPSPRRVVRMGDRATGTKSRRRQSRLVNESGIMTSVVWQKRENPQHAAWWVWTRPQPPPPSSPHAQWVVVVVVTAKTNNGQSCCATRSVPVGWRMCW